MGTRGLFGWYWKGKFYVVYNHWDSYPSGLGIIVLQEILAACMDDWKSLLSKMILINDDISPTQEQIEQLAEYTDLGVSSQSTTDWYCLLRKCQGSPTKVLQSGYMQNSVYEDGSPQFQEYAYIINFDDNTFDYYNHSTTITGSYPLDPDTLNKLLEKWQKAGYYGSEEESE